MANNYILLPSEVLSLGEHLFILVMIKTSLEIRITFGANYKALKKPNLIS